MKYLMKKFKRYIENTWRIGREMEHFLMLPESYSKEYKVEPIQFYHGDWPRLIMQANYIEPVTINPFSFFPSEGVTILAPKDRGVEDRQLAIEEFRRGTLRATDFAENIVPFTDAPAAYAALRDDKEKGFSLVFDWTNA
jgi:hypothetical protein